MEYVAKYDYRVAGNEHEGRWSSLASTGVNVGGYPYTVQQEVKIFHEPRTPDNSRLERGFTFRDLFLPLCGSAFLVAVVLTNVVYFMLK